MSLGQRIQERREELGITRAELARRLGVTSTAVANYEGGKNALREDLLLNGEEQEAVYIMRRALNGMKAEEAAENILNLFARTRTNQELVSQVRKQKFI